MSHRVKDGCMLISCWCIIFYLCSTCIVHRPSSILCTTTAFSPSRFTAHHFPKTPQCSVQCSCFSIKCYAIHIMQAYKPKQSMCEAMLVCIRSTFLLFDDFHVNQPPPSSLLLPLRILFVAESREHRSSVHRHCLGGHPRLLILRR